MAAASNHPPQRRETVEFPPNLPVTVALAYSEPRTVSGQFGERFMFSLSDGRVMFCDPPLAARIAELGINVRESIVITKQTSGKKDAPVTWDVARVIGEQPNGTFAVPKLPDAPAPKPPQRAANAAGGTLAGARRRRAPDESPILPAHRGAAARGMARARAGRGVRDHRAALRFALKRDWASACRCAVRRSAHAGQRKARGADATNARGQSAQTRSRGFQKTAWPELMSTCIIRKGTSASAGWRRRKQPIRFANACKNSAKQY